MELFARHWTTLQLTQSERCANMSLMRFLSFLYRYKNTRNALPHSKESIDKYRKCFIKLINENNFFIISAFFLYVQHEKIYDFFACIYPYIWMELSGKGLVKGSLFFLFFLTVWLRWKCEQLNEKGICTSVYCAMFMLSKRERREKKRNVFLLFFFFCFFHRLKYFLREKERKKLGSVTRWFEL